MISDQHPYDPLGRTEDDLRGAMARRADSIEPSVDAYERLEARMGGRPRVVGDRYRFLAAAAALVAVAGVGAAGLGLVGGGDEVSTVSPAVDTPQTTLAVDEPEATVTTMAQPEVTEAPDLRGFLAGPIAETRAEAAQLFVDLLGFQGATIEVSGNTATVFSPSPGGLGVGPESSILELSWVESRQGYSVTSASSDQIVIDTPTPPASANYVVYRTNPVTVSGRGTGYEAVVDMFAISVLDGVTLDRAYSGAGNFGELADFSADLSFYGSGRAWVVVQSSTGADDVIPAFSAVPISYDAPAHPTVFTVFGVPLDDADGGINVRNSPGLPSPDTELVVTTEPDGTPRDPYAVVATLPNGTAGIRLRSIVPTHVDGQIWWNITVDEVEGWVNGAYLVSDESLDRTELESLAVAVRDALNSGEPGAMAALPWSDRRGVWVGWSQALFVASGSEVATDGFWDAERQVVPVGMAESDGWEESLRSFMGSDSYELVPAGARFGSPYPSDQRVDESLLVGLTRVEFTNGRDSGWQNLKVYFEPSANGPRIAAVTTEIWIP